MASSAENVPLSLQNMSILHVIFRWEEFPLQVLSDLPLAIRRKLLHGLSVVDVLNLDGTPISNGVDLDFKQLRESLFSSYSMDDLLCIRNSIDCERYYIPDNMVVHIAKCYPSLDPTVIVRSYTNSVVLPSRSLQYISIAGSESTKSVESLLKHCKLMNTKQCQVKIDCCSFVDSVIWQDYLAQSFKRNHNYEPNVDVAYTLNSLKDFLSGIETLELCGSDTAKPELVEAVQAVSYVILHNVVTSNHPRLKHLIISGIPEATRWISAGVTKLLCKSTCEKPIAPYLLESISLLPCQPDNAYPHEYMLSESASEIANNLKAIVACQMCNLKGVTVHCLGFHYDWLVHDWSRLSNRSGRRMRHQRTLNTPEYRKLLSSLVDFLKQPQMQLLDIDKCPSPEAYQLIEAFLCTSTSIEQRLTIQVREEEEGCLEDYYEEEEEEEEEENKKDIHDMLDDNPLMPPISQPIPESSVKFKHLSMDMSSGRSIAWLLNLPELKVKSLKLCAYYLPLGSPDIVVQVEHITFLCGWVLEFRKPTILPNHLERFIVSNQALKKLEIITPYGPSEPWAPDFYPALNHCLSGLCRQQGRRLEELHMNSVSFKRTTQQSFSLQLETLLSSVELLFSYHLIPCTCSSLRSS